MNINLLINYYSSHRDELLAYVSSRLGGDDEAEDIVQDVFLRLLTSGRMVTETTLPALVYTTARNLMAYEHYLKHTSRTADNAESVLSVSEITAQLERSLARVPENCREIYRLHIYGGMKVGEISRRLGEGYKSVEHRLGTARKAVRQALVRYA